MNLKEEAKQSISVLNNRVKLYKISIVFLIVVFFGIIFFIRGHTPTITNNPYPLIDFARNFISQKDYIPNIQPIREKIKKMAQEFGNDNVSIYIEFLNTGANISINQDLYIWPASLSKLPFAIVVMKKVEDDIWSLDNELVLTSEDADGNSGDISNLLSDNKVGTRFTIEELLKATLVDSDNTAHNILLRNISKTELRDIIDAVGLERLFAPDGKVSAKEYSRLFRMLYTASYLDREHSQKILEYLNESTFGLFLKAGVPKEIIFPHKYGENIAYSVYADSGIVYLPNRPYLISVMVQGNPKEDPEKEEKRVATFITSVSKEVYDYFSTQ